MNDVIRKVLMGVILLFLFFSNSIRLSAQNWKMQNSPTNINLKSIFFFDKSYGWIVGDSGTVLTTNDGGKTWVKQNTIDGNDLLSVFFINENIGFCTGKNGTLLITYDGGNKWIKKNLNTNYDLRKIFFSSKNTGWIVGGDVFNGIIYKSTDQGGVWVPIAVNAKGTFTNLIFLNDNEGWIVGGKSLFDNYEDDLILHTSDSGLTWIEQLTKTNGPLFSVQFNKQNIGWVCGFSNSGGILKTIDKGNNWETIRIQRGNISWSEFFNDISAIDSTTVFVTTADTIYMTKDGGNNWIANKPESNNKIYKIFFIDKTLGWAVGGNGTIWKYDENVTSVTLTDEQPIQHALINIYPNPFNPTTTIKYSIPFVETQHAASQLVTLKVFDLLGREVAALVNEDKFPGNYEVKFDASRLTSGTYFYNLTANGRSITKKMILMK